MLWYRWWLDTRHWFLLALMINLMLEKTVTQADQKVRVAVTAGERAPNLVRFLEEQPAGDVEGRVRWLKKGI